MQKEYKNLYFMMTKYSPFPSNCLPYSQKFNNSGNLKKLFEISRSIANIVTKDTEVTGHKRRKSDQIMDLQKDLVKNQLSPKRIHNNYSHFLSNKTARILPLNPNFGQQQEKSKQKQETVRDKANSTIVGRRKDLYDDHIEKYMSNKYDNQELIKKYLTNRQTFIQQACQQIQKQIKQQYHLNKKSDKSILKKYRSRLPKIQQFSSLMLKKSINRNKDGTYIQQINQIKKAQELDIKNQQRRKREFRRKMNTLQVKLSHLKSTNQD